ncbi:MAG: polyprenyl synthetase family protein [Myxococcota bacterium]
MTPEERFQAAGHGPSAPPRGTASGLEEFLRDSRERVDGYLEKVLPPASEPPLKLHAAMRYAVFSGGKRLRPALAFAGAQACGADPECALPVAAAVELVHAYSLVHDDLPAMDDDTLRRGRPTVHVRFDEATAILTGDALLTEAFAVLGREPEVRELVSALAHAAGSRELVGGQADDLDFALEGADAESIVGIHRRKTAALFRFAVVGGGRAAGGDAAALEALDRFGLEYGLAFQLADDLDDASEAAGGACTALGVLSVEALRERCVAGLSRARAALDPLGPGSQMLRALGERLASQLP